MVGCKYDLVEEMDKQTTLNYHVAGGKTGIWREYGFACDMGRGDGRAEFSRGGV